MLHEMLQVSAGKMGTQSVCFQLSSNLFVIAVATATMIVTDQVPAAPGVTTSAQNVSRSYCGEIIHSQFC